MDTLRWDILIGHVAVVRGPIGAHTDKSLFVLVINDTNVKTADRNALSGTLFGHEPASSKDRPTTGHCIVMAYIVMTHIVMACTVMAYIAMAYIVMAYIVVACIAMACIAMACSYGLYSYGPYSYELHSYAVG